MVPCCMEVITCDEHSEILKQIEENGPMVGGAIGKHQTCPNDAAHAHQLASGKLITKSFMNGRFYETPLIIINIGKYNFNSISGEDEISCYDECLGSGKGPRQCSFECSGDDGMDNNIANI